MFKINGFDKIKGFTLLLKVLSFGMYSELVILTIAVKFYVGRVVLL